MEKQLANFFFDEASRTFAALVNEYSVAPPRLKIDDEIHFAFVTFMGKNLAFECVLDERASDVTCKIARIVNGRKTTYYGSRPQRYPSAGRAL